MSLFEIELDPRERGHVPPAEEFETVNAWLAALPARTVLIVTAGVEPFRHTAPVLVEDVIDGIAMAPIIQARLDELGK